MPDKNKSNQQPKGPQREQQKPFKDLNARKEDVDKVKGGRARFSSDPCEGGE